MFLAGRRAPVAGSVALAIALAVLTRPQAGDGQTAPQGLTVIPVSFEMAPGQMTAVLNIQNHTDREADFQVRPFAWDQSGGVDRLTPTDVLVASPPLGRIAVGGEQVVRIVLRQPAAGQEASYRILLDQVPPPPEPGVVNFALRLSIPVFVEPSVREAAHVRWSIQSDGAAYYLVAANTGARHESFHDIALTSADGRPVAIESNSSPYVLPGATRRWRILSKTFAPSRETLRLTAQANSGPVDQPVSASSAGS
jgi:fimbrial chaperone protein